jgi:hypothetical protein
MPRVMCPRHRDDEGKYGQGGQPETEAGCFAAGFPESKKEIEQQPSQREQAAAGQNGHDVDQLNLRVELDHSSDGWLSLRHSLGSAYLLTALGFRLPYLIVATREERQADTKTAKANTPIANTVRYSLCLPQTAIAEY